MAFHSFLIYFLGSQPGVAADSQGPLTQSQHNMLESQVENLMLSQEVFQHPYSQQSQPYGH